MTSPSLDEVRNGLGICWFYNLHSGDIQDFEGVFACEATEAMSS